MRVVSMRNTWNRAFAFTFVALAVALLAATASAQTNNVFITITVVGGGTGNSVARTAGPTFTASGTDTPLTGSSPVYTVTAAANTHTLTLLQLDGAAASSPITLTNIAGDHFINAVFTRTAYAVTSTPQPPNAAGTVTPQIQYVSTTANPRYASFTVTAGSLAGVPQQIYRYSIPAMGVAATVVPSIGGGDLHRLGYNGAQFALPVTITADCNVAFTFEDKYDFSIGNAGPADPTFPTVTPSMNMYTVAGTTVPATGYSANAYFYGDVVACSMATVNPDYKFGEDCTRDEIMSLQTTVPSTTPAVGGGGAQDVYWVVTGSTATSALTGPHPEVCTVTMTTDTVVTAWWVRAGQTPGNLGEGGLFWTEQPNAGQDTMFEPLETAKGIGINVYPIGGATGVKAELRFEDSMLVAVPSGTASVLTPGAGNGIIVDLGYQSGRPGAILFVPNDQRPFSGGTTGPWGATAYKPRVGDGGVTFGKLQINIPGIDYKLNLRYLMKRADASGNPLVPTGEEITPIDSDAFTCYFPGSAHYSWGYNYFGQLGIGLIDPITQTDPKTGLPGNGVGAWPGQLMPYTDASASGPIALPGDYTTAYPHFFELQSFTHNFRGWQGSRYLNAAVPPPSDNASWWVKFYHYGDGAKGPDEFENGRDMREAVLPLHQAQYGQGWESYQRAYTAVSTGQHHSLALRVDGYPWAWGDNTYGQLGLGAAAVATYTTPSGAPTFTDPRQCDGINDTISIAAGYNHSLFLRGDGRVWTCGRNNYGQLGYGATDLVAHPDVARVVDTSDPTGFLTNVVAIAAGDNYSMALKRDGSVWAWGSNSDGQLGDGTRTDRYVPTQIKGFKLTYFSGHTDRVTCVSMSPDGSYVATASYDVSVGVWDAASGVLLRTVGDSTNAGPNAHTQAITSVAWSPDGSKLLTGSADRTAKLWNSVDGSFVRAFVDGTLSGGTNTTDAHLGSVTSAQFSTNDGGARVVTSSVDGTAKVWTTATGALVSTCPSSPTDANGHTLGLNAAVFSPGGAFIYTGASDFAAKMWDVSTNPATFVCNFVDPTSATGHAHSGTVTSLAAATSAGSEIVISGSADCTAKIWTVDTVAKTATLTQTLRSLFDGNVGNGFSLMGHVDAVLSVAALYDAASGNTYLLTGSKDKTVKRWLLNAADPVTWAPDESYERHTDWITHVEFATVNDAATGTLRYNRVLSCAGGKDPTDVTRDNRAKLGHTPVVIQMDGGTAHSLAMKEDGTVWSWGYNNMGQLGLGAGAAANVLTPLQVVDGNDVSGFLQLGTSGPGAFAPRGVSAGNQHSIAVRNDLTVWTWGSNIYGELGINDQTPDPVTGLVARNTPQQVVDGTGTPISNIQAVSAGWGYSLARGLSGRYGWGHDNHGQLGLDGPGTAPLTAGTSAPDVICATATTNPIAPGGFWFGDAIMSSISAGYWHSQQVNTPGFHTMTWHIDPPGGGAVLPDRSSTARTSQTGQLGQTMYAYADAATGSVQAGSSTTVRLLAVPRPGYTFDHWDGYAPSQTTQTNWTYNNYDPQGGVENEVYAHFTAVPRKYKLTIITTVGGVPTAGPIATGAGTYNDNDVAVLTAIEDAQYKFDQWSGDPDVAGCKLNPAYLRMNSDKTITVNFTLKQYHLAVTCNPVSTATLTGTGDYLNGVSASISAVPLPGWRFGNWTILSGTGPVVPVVGPDPSAATIVMRTDTAVEATMIQTFTVTASTLPAIANGTVNGASPYVTVLDVGNGVTLTAATAQTGWSFDSWTGDVPAGSEKTNPLILTAAFVNKDLNLTANFVRQYTLQVAINPPGSGSYGRNPIHVPDSYTYGEIVDVLATPAAGYRFRNWSGAVTGTAPKVQVTMADPNPAVSTISITANMEAMATYAGELASWGQNIYGQLGDQGASGVLASEPTWVTNSTQVRNVASGRYHSLAVYNNAPALNGGVWAFGRNNYGQLGNGSVVDSNQIVIVRDSTGQQLVNIFSRNLRFFPNLLPNFFFEI